MRLEQIHIERYQLPVDFDLTEHCRAWVVKWFMKSVGMNERIQLFIDMLIILLLNNQVCATLLMNKRHRKPQ